jgi:hypothetical protein
MMKLFGDEFVLTPNYFPGNIKVCQKVIPKCEAEKLKHLKLKLGPALTSAQLEAASTIAQRALSLDG